MDDDKTKLPGNGFLGWLGRQVGYVTKAVKTDVVPPADSKIVYRDCTIEEVVSPVDPDVKLRRTIIDEVVKEKNLNRSNTQGEQE